MPVIKTTLLSLQSRRLRIKADIPYSFETENIMETYMSDNEITQITSSLDDAAALLIQTDPGNIPELTALREILNAAASDNSYPESSREKIVQAVRKIEEIIEPETSVSPGEASDILSEVSLLIEEAMHKKEAQGQTAEEPVPACGPPAEYKAGFKPALQAETNYMPEDADMELLGAFVNESSELISNAEEALLMLENDPENMEAVNTVFRTFHNIKGTSAFFELTIMTEMAHYAESFLSRVRDRQIRYTDEYADLALKAVDMFKELFQRLAEAMGGKPFFKPEGYDALLSVLAGSGSPGMREKSRPAREKPPAPLKKTDSGAAEKTAGKTPLSAPGTEPVSLKADIPRDDPETDSAHTEHVRSEAESLMDVARGLRVRETGERARQSAAESSVRVPVERLDRFVDMVGELVVSHSMVAQDEQVAGGTDLFRKVSQTAKIVRELQNMSMSMRMIPLKSVFQKMARLVRDLSRKLGKSVTFVTEGEDTEIDRNMVDMINDPLVHIVRNAVDHGIELPDERVRKGKPSHGTVKLSAYHSAGNVVIKVKDDGRGFDREAIFAKALQRGLIQETQGLNSSTVTDRELFDLVFSPGFSTAKNVSEVSGRGVGMDVVKKNVESLRGQIEIRSVPGEGSVFKINLPLTLAIIDGMAVRVGTERYVMPTVSIVRSVRPAPGEISKVFNKGEMLLLQGKLIPLFRLGRLFRIRETEEDPTRAIVVVVEDDGRQAGLVVDELIGSQQIVIKTLGKMIRNIVGISGSAIMPDGRVGLILDIGGLVRLANSD